MGASSNTAPHLFLARLVVFTTVVASPAFAPATNRAPSTGVTRCSDWIRRRQARKLEKRNVASFFFSVVVLRGVKVSFGSAPARRRSRGFQRAVVTACCCGARLEHIYAAWDPKSPSPARFSRLPKALSFCIFAFLSFLSFLPYSTSTTLNFSLIGTLMRLSVGVNFRLVFAARRQIQIVSKIDFLKHVCAGWSEVQV